MEEIHPYLSPGDKMMRSGHLIPAFPNSKCLSWTYQLVMMVLIWSTLFSFIGASYIRVTADVLEFKTLAFNLAYVASYILLCWKSTMLYVNRRRVQDMVYQINELLINQNEQWMQPHLYNASRKGKLFFYRLATAYYVFILVAVLASLPSLQTDQVRYPIPYGYGVNEGAFKITLVYIVEILQLAAAFHYLFAVYPFLFYLTQQISAQIQLLCLSFEQISSEHENKLQLFKDSIKHHHKILRILQLFNSVESKTFIIDFVCNPFQVCFALYELTQRDYTDPMYMNILNYIIIAFLQPFFLSWCGEKLKTESEKITDAVYSVPWYSSEIAFRKTVLTTLTNVNQPFQFNFKRLLEIDYKTYSAFLSATYSYLTMFITLFNKN